MKLEEIEKICNEATPGPWVYHHYGEEILDDEICYDWYLEAKEYNRICENPDGTNHINGKFISMARTELPKLVDYIRSLEAALGREKEKTLGIK